MFGRSSTATATGDTVVEERDDATGVVRGKPVEYAPVDYVPVDDKGVVDEPVVEPQEQVEADSTRRIPTFGRKKAAAAPVDAAPVDAAPVDNAPVDAAPVYTPPEPVAETVAEPTTVTEPTPVTVVEPQPVEPEPVVEPKRFVHVSMVAALSTIVGVAAMGATLTGLLAPLGFAAGVVALLLGVLGMYSVARPNVTGHSLVVFGLVLGAAALVLSVLAMNGELSWLSSKTDEIAKVHGWLNEHMHWLRRF